MLTTYVKLRGLNREAVYLDQASGNVYFGAALMEMGIPLDFPKIEYEAYQIALTEMETVKDLYRIMVKYIHPLNQKMVISIFGGSGCGKTTLSAVISQYLLNDGIGCYVLGGDHYPIRIPKENDEERQRIYEEKGTEGLAGYLGTPDEIDFDAVNQVIAEFKAGKDMIALRRLGREIGEVSYELH